jgi:putative nucleotidyltransferase with HDIG domain
VLAPMLERFTMVLANTIETKDAATQQHANRLVHLAQRMTVHLGLDPEAASAVRYGACLHDIGKVAVPQELLVKPSSLTDDEMDLMRSHPVVGAEILGDIETWDGVRQVVRHHHERFDGAGYPDGLRGEAIPLGARLVSVVDAFDVMRSGRPYAPALSQDQILGELHRERGRQFDPDMVDTLLAVVTPADFGVATASTAAVLGRPPQVEEPHVSIAGWLAAEQRQPLRAPA